MSKPFEGHKTSINQLAISPDGSKLISYSNDGTTIIWNMETRESLYKYEDKNADFPFIITEDNKKFLNPSSDHSIKLMDLESGKILHSFTGHTDQVRSLALIPGGERFISGSYDKSIKVWDLQNGNLLFSLNGQSEPTGTLSVTHDGKKVVAGGGGSNETQVWSLDTGSPLLTLKIPTSGIYTCKGVSITPDEKHVLTGNNGGSISEWDLKSGELERTLQLYEKNKYTSIVLIEKIYITPDGKNVFSMDNNHVIKIWDYSSGHIKRTQEVNVWTLTITPDGKRIIQAQTDNSIVITDLLTGKNITSKKTGFFGKLKGI